MTKPKSHLSCPGIYAIRCLIDGKLYIGSAVRLGQRLSAHRHNLRSGKHQNKHLQNAWSKHGESQFSFDVLECVLSEDSLLEAERYWIVSLDSIGSGYNVVVPEPTTRGARHTDETRARMSEIARNRDHSHLRQNAEKMRGQPAHNRGKPGKRWTEEHIATHSERLRGKPTWNKGIQTPDAVKQKISVGSARKLVKFSGDIVEKVRWLRSSGLAYSEISKLVGVSAPTAQRIATGSRTSDKLGDLSNAQPRTHIGKVPPEMLDAFIADRAAGMSLSAIARKHGVSPACVSKRLSTHQKSLDGDG